MKDDVAFELLTYKPEETIALGARLGCVAQLGDVIILTGDLGAGKTQFAKGVAQGLGVCEVITSPTFNIMLVYESSSGQKLNHIDLYRLDDILQLDDIDYFGCLESDAVSVVEWGDRFATALPADYLEVSLELLSPDAVVPHVLAPDVVAPDVVAPDAIAPDTVALGVVASSEIAPDMVFVEPSLQECNETESAMRRIRFVAHGMRATQMLTACRAEESTEMAKEPHHD